jgi:hypothetical protein
MDLKGEILEFCVLEYKSAEKLRCSSKFREYLNSDYVSIIKGLHWLLQNGGKLGGVCDRDFQLFLPIVKNLIEKGQMEPEFLVLFD